MYYIVLTSAPSSELPINVQLCSTKDELEEFLEELTEEGDHVIHDSMPKIQDGYFVSNKKGHQNKTHVVIIKGEILKLQAEKEVVKYRIPD